MRSPRLASRPGEKTQSCQLGRGLWPLAADGPPREDGENVVERLTHLLMKGEEVAAQLDISVVLKGVNDQTDILFEQPQQV